MLHDAKELVVFESFVQEIEERRKKYRGFTSEPLEAVVTRFEQNVQEALTQTEELAAAVAVNEPVAIAPVTATESDAANALRSLIAAKGVEVAVAVLGSFGVKRAGELDPTQRGPFIARVEKELA